MLHTRKKSFYSKPSSLSNKLFFDAGSTLMLLQQESEKMIWKQNLNKNFYNVSTFKENNNKTRPILNLKFYNALDFGLKKMQRVRIWNQNFSTGHILEKNSHSKNHVLVQITPWKRHVLHFSRISKNMILHSKISLRVRFWIERIQRVRFWLEKNTKRQILKWFFSSCQVFNEKFNVSEFQLKFFYIFQS